jgi:hypothetical protein
VASNSRSDAPFLTYLTVFKSRLGLINFVIPITGLAYMPSATLLRRLKGVIGEQLAVDVGDPKWSYVFDYLVEKKLIGTSSRLRGRYTDFSLAKAGGGWIATGKNGEQAKSVSVFRVDVFMADPTLPSTVGVPTVENSDEALELCFQLNLLSRLKCTWTAAGQLIDGLRKRTPTATENPLRLGLEGIALLRQVLEVDGLIICEILRYITSQSSPLRRDSVALHLPDIVRNALAVAKTLRLAPPVLTAGKRFLDQVVTTAGDRASASTAPGVLEHRTSPRLEWLCDFGVLSKHSRPRNAFEYDVTTDALLLLKILDETSHGIHWADEAALKFWRDSSYWKPIREQLSPVALRPALLAGYRVMKRSVGPASIRDTCFAALSMAPTLSLGLDEAISAVVDWATSESHITLSGGRYTRSPELLHIGEPLLASG